MTDLSRHRAHGAAAAAVLAAAIYLSSGTMAPYAATDSHPLVLEPCHYLANVDHYHYEAVFRMIAGDDEGWSGSVVLRRLLFPVLAYPFVKVAGLMAGGLLASILLNVAALLVFGAFVRRKFGTNAAIAGQWLLATYPGITYWAGLPYSYVAIVPGSLLGLILLYRLDERTSLGHVLRTAFVMGLIFTAYDLFSFFGPAAIFVLAVRRRWRQILPVIVVMAIPGLLIALTFAIIAVPIVNANTQVYQSIVAAWFDLDQYNAEWIGYLAELPLVLVSSLLFGNMIFLPVLALAGAVVLRRRKAEIIALPDGALLVAGLLIFLFTNAAPPYDGWQVRGYWLARLYQPLIGVLLMVAARATQTIDLRTGARWRVAVVATVLINASVAFGPVLMNPLAEFVYHRFYVHTPSVSLLTNLERHGRRPLGFCSASHEWDSIESPKTPLNRPSYMYRYPAEVTPQRPGAGTTRR